MTLKIGGAKNHKAVITDARKNIYKKGSFIIRNSVIRRRPEAKKSFDLKLRQLQLNIEALALKNKEKTSAMQKITNSGDQAVKRNSTYHEKSLLSELAALNLQEDTLTTIEANYCVLNNKKYAQKVRS